MSRAGFRLRHLGAGVLFPEREKMPGGRGWGRGREWSFSTCSSRG